MMEKIFINVEKSTRMVTFTRKNIGNDLENLQQELVFKFTDEFVNGSARLEYKIDSNKYHIPMTKEDESYSIPIKNVITKEGKIQMQLVIVQVAQDEEIPVFKSNVFEMYCNKSINAQEEAPDDYEYWLDVIEEKLAEVDEALEKVDKIDIDATKTGSTATVSITNKEGTTKSVEIYDGQTGAVGPQGPKGDKGDKGDKGNTGDRGPQGIQGVKGDKGDTGSQGPQGIAGKDAKINGENTIEIKAGTNITIDQGDKTLTINSTGGGGSATWGNIGGTLSDQTDLNTALSSKVSNTDYAGSNKSGVIRTNADYGTSITSVGALISATKTYQQYQDTTTPNMFISKGTLENVITGKGLVSNTDYATSNKAGVIKCFNSDGLTINNGTLITATKTYAQYNSAGNWMFVGKGTLENVLAGKGLNQIVTLTQQEYDALATKDANTYYYIVEE